MANKLPQFKSCCMCCSVRTGATVICVIEIVVACFLLVTIRDVVRKMEKEEARKVNGSDLDLRGIVLTDSQKKSLENDGTIELTQHQKKKILASQPYAILARAVIIYLTSIIFNVLYLVGVKKERPKCMLPNLWIHVLEIILYSLEGIVYLFTTEMSSKDGMTRILEIGTATYYFLVLNSYYQEMSQQQQQSQSGTSIPLDTQQVAVTPGGTTVHMTESSFINQQPVPPQYAVMPMPIPYSQPVTMIQQPTMMDPSCAPPTYDSVFPPKETRSDQP